MQPGQPWHYVSSAMLVTFKLIVTPKTVHQQDLLGFHIEIAPSVYIHRFGIGSGEQHRAIFAFLFHMTEFHMHHI